MKMRADEVRVLLVIAAIAALFVVAAWLPMHLRANELAARIGAARQEAARRAVETEGMARLAQRVADMEQHVASMPRGIGAREDPAQLLRQLSSHLSRRDAEDRELLTRPHVRYPHYTLTPMSLRFKATFQDVYELIRMIESLPRLTCVTSLEIQTPARGDERGLLEVRVGLASFDRPTEEQP